MRICGFSSLIEHFYSFFFLCRFYEINLAFLGLGNLSARKNAQHDWVYVINWFRLGIRWNQNTTDFRLWTRHSLSDTQELLYKTSHRFRVAFFITSFILVHYTIYFFRKKAYTLQNLIPQEFIAHVLKGNEFRIL